MVPLILLISILAAILLAVAVTVAFVGFERRADTVSEATRQRIMAANMYGGQSSGYERPFTKIGRASCRERV